MTIMSYFVDVGLGTGGILALAEELKEEREEVPKRVT